LAIHRLLKNFPFEPKEIRHVIGAYERALHTLCVKDRDDPLTEMIAQKIIKIAQSGVHDPAQISALAIKELEVR
jgi:indole-3-glycerol phosphate synthase